MWNARFAFILIHEAASATGRSTRTSGPIHGAQSAGSAQSYALKQLMRGLFLIPTGDADDPDKGGVDIAGKGEHQTDLQKVADTIARRSARRPILAELGLTWSDQELNLELVRGASKTAFEFLEKEYATRKAELEDA
jgi:hypothetical protein